MNPAVRLRRIREEHAEILRLLGHWEEGLRLLDSPRDEDRVLGLHRFREIEPQLSFLRDHCQAEDEDAESIFGYYLDQRESTQLREEHRRLEQLRNDFHRELQFATMVRTGALITLGNEFFAFLRQHIENEEKLLNKVESGRGPREARGVLLG